MEPHRLNPITLISGAATPLGAGCARLLSRRSEGGLILVDADADALDRAADALTQPPERVSTLAIDTSDPGRWADARNFIQAQYGRIDWAIVTAAPRPPPDSELVDWRTSAEADLSAAYHGLRAAMDLIGENTQGGAIILAASALPLEADGAEAAAKAGLLQLVRAAAHEGGPNNIRVNAIAPGGPHLSAWADMANFQQLARDYSSERAACEALMRRGAPIARYGSDNVAGLMLMLLADECPLTGAALMVDAGDVI
ncbi:MAG: SDR family oxidoreductase [Terricaulis sp.]|nr:SDR family oxidoreductase [Terricaulis sp.]